MRSLRTCHFHWSPKKCDLLLALRNRVGVPRLGSGRLAAPARPLPPLTLALTMLAQGCRSLRDVSRVQLR
jgi:hypothetical protein